VLNLWIKSSRIPSRCRPSARVLGTRSAIFAGRGPAAVTTPPITANSRCIARHRPARHRTARHRPARHRPARHRPARHRTARHRPARRLTPARPSTHRPSPYRRPTHAASAVFARPVSAPLVDARVAQRFSRNASAGRRRAAYWAGRSVATRQTTTAKTPTRAKSLARMRTGSLEMK
jgi:hypothetical protein